MHYVAGVAKGLSKLATPRTLYLSQKLDHVAGVAGVAGTFCSI